jgi:hypothetical protein
MVWFKLPKQASWKLAIASVALFTFSSVSNAGVIVSVTDLSMPVNRATFSLGGEFSNTVTVSWTQGESFSGVSIDASLVSIDQSFDTGTAYLMSSIGPGTTAMSEVVPPMGFTAPIGNQFGEVPTTVLFSGLTLPAGTYYLVLTAPFASIMGSPLLWQVATEPDIITGPSVTIGDTNEANTFITTVDPFAPASSFVIDSVDRPLFDVVSNISEPQTTTLLLIPFVALMFGWCGIRYYSHV